jgi:uncharacterized protein (TIGR01319 family)
MNQIMLITDIGSTTTKAILIAHENENWLLKGLASAPTTVEKPHEDVMIGVITAVTELQAKTGTVLLTGSNQINQDIKWLSTSSAGGGLQMLVIGLVKEESAASAGRAAFGVGGILLDTIAIDDGRSVVQQMHAIEEKQPDIILMSGGYEGGAYASVLRQAEILSYCEIKPKYTLKDKIPLIYAGNADAANAIRNILQESFEVHVLQNIRPTEDVEHIGHVTELVHELFLNKVMQQAPGYKAVSSMVSDPVIPTPLGVMQALKLIAETEQKNILAVDIGGATTDVYSNIFSRFYRTVSANFGMSYNICNVFAKADKTRLQQWLHPSLTETDLRNYVANKMLYPTLNPDNDATLHIEQAMARIALQLSLHQHLQMNFSVSNIGHFLKLKDDELDPFHEQFFREKLNERAEFRLQDFHMIIGAGGVISHAPTEKQAAIMLIDGLQPRGMTELWRDNHFISPHLGKLSQVDNQAALELLKTECLEPLCLCIRPLPERIKPGKPALTIELKSEQGSQIIEAEGNRLYWIDNKVQVSVHAVCHGSVRIAYEKKELSFETSLPILIDTRISGKYTFVDLNTALGLYHDIRTEDTKCFQSLPAQTTISVSQLRQRRTFSLPYAGRIYVSVDDAVRPDTVLGENLYDPPRIFVLQVFRGQEAAFSEESFRKNLKVSAGDEVKNGQLILHEQHSFIESLMNAGFYNYHSPVRGKVEKIDWQNGTILMREIQDYSFDPVVINVSDKLGINPGNIKGSLRKRMGEYVTTGELLGVRDWKKDEHRMHSPATGTITEIDTRRGTITIQYIRKNLRLLSLLEAKVISISRNRFIELEYDGSTISGSIGFGKMTDGPVVWNDSFTEADLKADFISIFPFALNREQLEIVRRNRLAGIIVPSLNEEDVTYLLGYELGVGITGSENLPFSIILTNGFGNFTFSQELASTLKSLSGKHGVMLPATQIRAGVIRPSLIIQS